MKYNSPQSASQNLKIDLKITALKLSLPTGTLAVNPTLAKSASGLDAILEKSDVLISNKIDVASLETIQPKLYLLPQNNISPFLANFIESYREVFWLADYLKNTIETTNLNICNLTIKVDLEPQSVIIHQFNKPKIIYRVQHRAITFQELDKITEYYRGLNISCRWFFGGAGANKVSLQWSFERYGDYCCLKTDSKTSLITASRSHPYNSVSFPLDSQDDRIIIRDAIDY